MSSPVLMALIPSMEPVVLKAQQEPHAPWFLTGVTAPSALQSFEDGIPATSAYLKGVLMLAVSLRCSLAPTKPKRVFENSSKVRSAK